MLLRRWLSGIPICRIPGDFGGKHTRISGWAPNIHLCLRCPFDNLPKNFTVSSLQQRQTESIFEPSCASSAHRRLRLYSATASSWISRHLQRPNSPSNRPQRLCGATASSHQSLWQTGTKLHPCECFIPPSVLVIATYNHTLLLVLLSPQPRGTLTGHQKNGSRFLAAHCDAQANNQAHVDHCA